MLYKFASRTFYPCFDSVNQQNLSASFAYRISLLAKLESPQLLIYADEQPEPSIRGSVDWYDAFVCITMLLGATM
jgi:hypothetical protein